MSDTGRDANLIPDDVQANYRLVRLERNWTWVQLAEDFERQAEATRQPDASFLRLAMWARTEATAAGEAPGPNEREGTIPKQPRKGRPGKRTTEAKPAPQRTDAVTTADSVTDVAEVANEPAGAVPVAV